MIVIKQVSIDTNATIIAHVQCEDPIGLNEEDRIRKMLGNFYAKEKRDFARVAVQIAGAAILFRTISNCKRPPTHEEIAMVLRAINCFTPNAISRPSHKKRSAVATSHSHAT